MSTIQCRNCFKWGHKAYACHSSKRGSTTGNFSSTVECYGCRQQVADLQSHRPVCTGGRGSNKGETRRGTIECYDCHQHVANLKSHRAECLKSRRAKSALVPAPHVHHRGRGRGHRGNKATLVAVSKDVWVLLDVSASMEGARLSNAKEALLERVDEMNECDRLAVVSFDHAPFLKLKPRPVGQLRRQNEMPELLARIYADRTFFKTALYDSVKMAADDVIAHRKDLGHKVHIIALTDGGDNSSQHLQTSAATVRYIDNIPNMTLDIVHIDESKRGIRDYKTLCEGRGEYVVVEELSIKTTLRRIFLKY